MSDSLIKKSYNSAIMNAETRTKVVVGMSGGVDSSVSAALLKKRGYDVMGVFIKCWSDEEFKTGMCTYEDDERWGRRAAKKIGIPFYSIDLVREYRDKVVEYFISEYKQNRTPNPDVMCNREIKFGVFYDWAINNFGADFVATGHYARIDRNLEPKTHNLKPRLLKGKDPNKDQSYFLWAVEREKFKKVIFPVGGYLKSEVRELARKFGLPNHARPDSQGICFIGELKINDFLRGIIKDNPGDIMNSRGEVLGYHRGLHYYTIGQRRGINIGGGAAYYAARKNYITNTLIVSREDDEELFARELVCSNLNWISKKPRLPFVCKAKIRYRQADEDVIIKSKDKDGNLLVEFCVPQRAVTPGQSTVFYKGEELIGGGVIN